MTASRGTTAPGRARRAVRVMLAAVMVALTTTVLTLTQAVPVAAQPGQTTSTLPTDNRELGNSLPKPNRGMEPQDAGDPGGWLQVSLFFLICGAILVMVGLVWWTSRRARARRDAAGFDPVDVARRTGTGVRTAPVGGSGSGDPA